MNPSALKKTIVLLLLLFFCACASVQPQTAEDKRADDIWQAACSFCHGVDGTPPEMWANKGVRKFGTLGMKMGFFFGGDKMRAGIAKTIAEGKGQEMRPFKDHLTSAEITALVRHIEGL